MSSRLSSNSEASASELQENPEECGSWTIWLYGIAE